MSGIVEDRREGPLAGLRVVELASEVSAFAGKLMADMGADVVVVEPPGGSPLRAFEPFFEDRPGPERSLVWWHYNTSKRGVVLDVEREEDLARLRKLVASADLLIECETEAKMRALGLDVPDVRGLRPDIIHVSITSFGRADPHSADPFTDMTVLAGGGPVWSCGYDDHSLPPVRGGGNQGYHTACHYAVMSALVALLVRDETGEGQHLDVNMHAAANVTTEAATYDWLVAGGTVQRQTGRHAAPQLTMPSQVRCADGRYVNTGVPPLRPREFEAMYEWLVELGLADEFREAFLLELGGKRDFIDLSKIREDPELAAIFGAGREARNLIASNLSAVEFFIGSQERGLPVGVVYAPEEVMEDPHFAARGFRVDVAHPELGRSFVYAGAPIRFGGSPWRIGRRAPLLGEHDHEVLGAL